LDSIDKYDNIYVHKVEPVQRKWCAIG